MSKKAIYRRHCREESISIFCQDWWLDTVVGDENWDVSLIEKDNKVVASMPYVKRTRYGMTQLTQPPLSQHLGPWLRPSSAKYAKALGQQKDLMNALIDQLPDYHYFSQNWHYGNNNWLPFFWRGFSQTTRYTYVIDKLDDHDDIWNQLQPNIRTDIKKARDRLGVSVRDDLDIDDFLELNQLVFERQGLKLPYSRDLVRKIDEVTKQHGCSKILIAEDETGRRHAGVYIIWDHETAYYIMGGGDPELRNSGATSLCMWEAIKFASTVVSKFDFEGSMIESVERFFRGFGAKQMPYSKIVKSNSKIIELVKLFKGKG